MIAVIAQLASYIPARTSRARRSAGRVRIEPAGRLGMEFQLEQAVEILSRTPAILNALLRDLPVAWVLKNEGGASWCPYDVVGHLLHGEETDWLPRPPALPL